jgi:hypothetical protein
VVGVVLRRRSKAEVFRITGARTGLDEDIRGRQRRYVISMSVRTVAVILAVLLWDVTRPVAVVALVLGFILPYVAVVIANAGRENAPSMPSTFVSGETRRALTSREEHPGRHPDEAAPPPEPGARIWKPEPEGGAEDSASADADRDRPPSTPGNPL